MEFLEPILTALSLCADCFAVSLCSSVSIKKIEKRQIFKLALCFAIIQTSLFLAGWLFGSIFLGLVQKISNILGGALLIYVGFTMLLEGLKNESECRDLNGLKNIIIAGVATSIDALTVGAAASMHGSQANAANTVLAITLFVITFISVVAGILSAKVVGKSLGRWAEIIGGAVLLGLGVSFIIG